MLNTRISAYTMTRDTAAQTERPTLDIRLGSWNSMKSETNNDVPNVQKSLNIRTDCGFNGEANSIGTSAGRKILLEFWALRIFVASKSRNTAEIAISTICSVLRSCFAIRLAKRHSSKEESISISISSSSSPAFCSVETVVSSAS